ncbi:FtsB family cell division protein [Oryzihumus leptocrescens]|uniref:Cell division protein FtsB n=1 Tax=Oryzihumus leptocrescens TaxID=297536 RepID=A0A542ZFI7_9MICO|nr:septum formation initiator family protein [Oryzihumus leptocrescens]TQL59081.1 cell division protein FtsB [Oryzihumus leptocrescens]
MAANRPGSAPRSPRRTGSPRSGAAATSRPSTPRKSAGRPATSARSRRPRGDQRTPRSLRRMAILASIFVMLAVLLVPTLRSYLRQQGEIEAMRHKVAQQGKAVDALRVQKQQWDDPAYIQEQARQRLKMVKVGERSFTVLDASPASPQRKDPQVASVPAASGRNHPWYGQLWESMVIADTPPQPTPGATTPAPLPTPGHSTP